MIKKENEKSIAWISQKLDNHDGREGKGKRTTLDY